MKIRRTLHTIDTHTCGEPTRTIVGGLPVITGRTMLEKMNYMSKDGDYVRKLLCYEPRGNEVMSGTVITEPCDPSADLGILYFEVGGWMPMCGHDTIGVGTALIESGIIKAEEPYTYVTLDTAAGLVKLKIEVEDCTAKSVTFTNAPAFVLRKDAVIDTKKYGLLNVDIAYGGNIYAILPVEKVGLTVDQGRNSELIEAGNSIKADINEQIKVCHPEIPFEDHVTHVEFYEEGTGSGGATRNAVIIPPGAIDRSPCGTGTSAKLSVLAVKNKINKGESFVHESIIGSQFICKYLDDTKVCGIDAVIPQITGSAWVTGIHTFILDPDDIFPEGFQLERSNING